MKKRKLTQFEKMLHGARRALLEEIGECYDETLRVSGDSSSEALSGYLFHPAEAGTNNYEQDRAAGLITSKSGMLKEIESALARIREGRFGICEECGCNIPLARLEAIPYCRVCVKCKLRAEISG